MENSEIEKELIQRVIDGGGGNFNRDLLLQTPIFHISVVSQLLGFKQGKEETLKQFKQWLFDYSQSRDKRLILQNKINEINEELILQNKINEINEELNGVFDKQTESGVKNENR